MFKKLNNNWQREAEMLCSIKKGVNSVLAKFNSFDYLSLAYAQILHFAIFSAYKLL